MTFLSSSSFLYLHISAERKALLGASGDISNLHLAFLYLHISAERKALLRASGDISNLHLAFLYLHISAERKRFSEHQVTFLFSSSLSLSPYLSRKEALLGASGDISIFI